MIKIILKLLGAGIIGKFLHSINVFWYGTRMNFLMTDKFSVQLFDRALFGVIIAFLLITCWKTPVLKGKYKKAYNVLKITFHTLIIGYIIYEGFHTCTIGRMFINLLIYALLELILLILHYIANKPKSDKESPPTLLLDK